MIQLFKEQCVKERTGGGLLKLDSQRGLILNLLYPSVVFVDDVL